MNYREGTSLFDAVLTGTAIWKGNEVMRCHIGRLLAKLAQAVLDTTASSHQDCILNTLTERGLTYQTRFV